MNLAFSDAVTFT